MPPLHTMNIPYGKVRKTLCYWHGDDGEMDDRRVCCVFSSSSSCLIPYRVPPPPRRKKTTKSLHPLTCRREWFRYALPSPLGFFLPSDVTDLSTYVKRDEIFIECPFPPFFLDWRRPLSFIFSHCAVRVTTSVSTQSLLAD